MYAEVRQSMNKGKRWASIAVPFAVQRCWPGATVHRVEDEDHPACKLLDTTCGIDWLIEHRGMVRGLSVRCQARRYLTYGVERWDSPTFTIRRDREGGSYTIESELKKTIDAVIRGAITAAYHLHAYMDVDEGPASTVLAFGMALRAPLFYYALNHAVIEKTAHDLQRGQAQNFIAIPFSQLTNDILVRFYRQDRAV